MSRSPSKSQSPSLSKERKNSCIFKAQPPSHSTWLDEQKINFDKTYLRPMKLMVNGGEIVFKNAPPQ